MWCTFVVHLGLEVYFLFIYFIRSYLKLDTLEDAYLTGQGDDYLSQRHGCLAYISPETLEANNTFSGKAADVWCLGIILYTILVGHYPFNDIDQSSLFQKIKRCQFRFPDALSPKAKCLIHNILRPDPMERLTAKEILDHPWFSSNNWTGNMAGDPSDKERCDQMVPSLLMKEERSVWET